MKASVALPCLVALLSLLGTSWATLTKKPSDIKLKWLEDEVIDGDTLPHMEITFADGTTDEIFLKPDTENDCFYHGSLKSDIESEVEVDGCKNHAEIVEISSRLVPCGLVILLLEDGKTYTINPYEGIEYPPEGTDAVAPVAAGFSGASWQGALPTTVVAKIHVRYDPSLVDMFGNREAAKRKVEAIVHLARPYFKRILGLSMNIDIEIISSQYYDTRIVHPHSNGALNGLSGRGGGGGHSTAWFRAAQGNNAAGIAHLQGLCRGDLGLITEVFKETWYDSSSALLFAHELGHNLGMEHDFEGKHIVGSSTSLNRDAAGHYGPCNDKGIMSYQPPQDLPKRWSDCSRKDQEETFKKFTHSCMARGSGGGGGGGPPPASGCRCNGRVVQSGRYQGAGSCDWGGSVSCGSFCFVDRGTCREEFRITGFENYGYASCTPCPNSRNAPALKTAECPSTGSSIGKEVGFLAAGLLMALVI